MREEVFFLYVFCAASAGRLRLLPSRLETIGSLESWNFVFVRTNGATLIGPHPFQPSPHRPVWLTLLGPGISSRDRSSLPHSRIDRPIGGGKMLGKM